MAQLVHSKKKIREFPVPSRDVTSKLSLGGNNDVITELFLPRGSLVSDIPAGDGKLVNLFYGVVAALSVCIFRPIRSFMLFMFVNYMGTYDRTNGTSGQMRIIILCD